MGCNYSKEVQSSISSLVLAAAWLPDPSNERFSICVALGMTQRCALLLVAVAVLCTACPDHSVPVEGEGSCQCEAGFTGDASKLRATGVTSLFSTGPCPGFEHTGPGVNPKTLKPKSQTPKPTPQPPTQTPRLRTSNLKPHTPNSTPQTPNPKPQTPNPKPQTPKPSA